VAENSYRLTFTQTEEDLWRFFWYHLNHERSRRLLVWGYYPVFVLAIAYCVYTLGISFAEGLALSPTIPLTTGAVGGLLAAVGYPPFLRWLLRKRARRHAQQMVGAVGERTYEVSPTGIFWDWGSGQANQKWISLHRVASTPEYIYLYQGRNQAHIFPRRAFASPEAAEGFLKAATQWHAEATGGEHA
jgi:hypothetical protein